LRIVGIYETWNPFLLCAFSEAICHADATGGRTSKAVLSIHPYSRWARVSPQIIDLSREPADSCPRLGEFRNRFNGEIHNYVEITDDLERLGTLSNRHSDTETVLRTFMPWDTDFSGKLRGCSRFALLEPIVERSLFFARDSQWESTALNINVNAKSFFWHPDLKHFLIRKIRDLKPAAEPCPVSILSSRLNPMCPAPYSRGRNRKTSTALSGGGRRKDCRLMLIGNCLYSPVLTHWKTSK